MGQSKLFLNGKVWKDDGTFYDALGIRKNKIVFVGTNDDAKNIKNDFDEIIDVNKRVIVPGLNDCHVHLIYGSLMKKRIDCSKVKNISELSAVIDEYRKKNPELYWLVGGNINLTNIAVNQNFLDDIISDKPVYIVNYDYHSGYCNNLAFEKSGLKEAKDKFSCDEVILDESGKFTGIVKERAMKFIFNNLPQPSLKFRTNALKDFISVMNSYGITAVSDIIINEDFEVYKNLLSNDKLKLRISGYIPYSEFNNYEKINEEINWFDKEVYKIKGFKAFYDGALGSETGYFIENYLGKDYNGYKTEMAESGELFRIAKEIDSAGMQSIVHAIGDKAVSELLDICEEIIKQNGKDDRRFRIEHAQHIDEKDFERFKRNEIIASVQPVHLIYDSPIVKSILTENLVKRTHNYKNLLDLGVKLVFGTDFPIAEINPWMNIQTAVTRKTGNEYFMRENRISLNNCIKAYTSDAAYSTFSENKIGTLEPGKFADFIILEDDIFEIDEDSIGNCKVWKTFFNGVDTISN